MTVGTGQQERSTTKEPATEDHQSPINLVKVGRFIVGHGIELFRLAKEKGLEGIIAKRAASTYQPRRRSPDRLKINARLKKKLVSAILPKAKQAENKCEHCSWASMNELLGKLQFSSPF